MNFRRLDISSLAVDGFAHAAIGGAQQMAWRQTRNVGFFATGGAILGGIALQAMNAPMAQKLGHAAFGSGLSILGWQLAQKFVPGSPALPLGMFGGRGGRAPSYMNQPNYNPAGQMPSYAGQPRALAAPGGRLPQASLMSTNPNTGESVLVSRI